jgi:hypothetical protein
LVAPVAPEPGHCPVRGGANHALYR